MCFVFAALLVLSGVLRAQQAACNGEDVGAPSISQFGVDGDEIRIEWPFGKNTSKLPTSLEWIDNRAIDGTYTIHETFGDGSQRTFSMDDQSFRNELADLCGGSRPWNGSPAFHSRPRANPSPPPLTRAGFASQFAASGDLNGDGAVDRVAVFNLSLYVTLQDQSGNQISQKRTDLPALGASLILRDVNHDGQLDILVALLDAPGGVGVLLGNGDGTFKPITVYKAAADSSSLAAADFNGDQKVDLAVATGSGVAVLLGNGDGSFQAPVSYNAGMQPVSLVAADFNGDGYVDIAVADALDGTVSVLLNQRDVTFAPAVSSRANGPASPAALAYADLNGDGNLDVAVAYKYSSTVAIVLGDGKGNFGSPAMYAAGAYPGSVALLPLASGEFSMLTEDDLGQAVVVTAGAPDGTAVAPKLQFAGAQIGSAALMDVNRDGNLDVVLTDVKS
ncbi:MAG TPA: VCBS repeat-containing protein, partial [Bryobacteraceae bacterium]|nr:VCBS repeat-containing protein [Bryobacteraceae bacterium]